MRQIYSEYYVPNFISSESATFGRKYDENILAYFFWDTM